MFFCKDDFSKYVGLLFIVVSYASPAMGYLRFRTITTDNGLSNARVFDILQDSQGYIWLATEDGLDRYDGYVVRVFKHDPRDPKSLSADVIRALYKDAEGRLWIGTMGGGLDLYDKNTGSFRHFRHQSTNPSSLSSNNIWSLGGTTDGKLCIGTYDKGFDIFDPKTGQTRHYPLSDAANIRNGIRINVIYPDKNGMIWLGTDAGLIAFDEQTRQFVHHINNQSNAAIIHGIVEDRYGTLWLATSLGLQKYNPNTRERKYPKTEWKGGDLSAIYVDSDDNMWIGRVDYGLYLRRHGSSLFVKINTHSDNSSSFSSGALWKIYQDRNGLLWFATDNGVDLLDPHTEATNYIQPLQLSIDNPHASNKITAVLPVGDTLLVASTAGIYRFQLAARNDDTKGAAALLLPIDTQKYRIVTSLTLLDDHNILATTGNGWLIKINLQGNILHSWKIGSDLGLNNAPLMQAIATRGNLIYLSTIKNGLLEFDLSTLKTRRFGGSFPSNLPHNAHILEFIKTSPSKMWLATTNGLFRIDSFTGKNDFIPLGQKGENPEPISLYADAQHHLWVGTIRGLWCLTLDDNGNPLQRKYFTVGGNSISGIEPDENGDLWLAGDSAIIKFNPKTGATLAIGRDQNLPVSGFYAHVHARTNNGWVWFGGPNGLAGIDPQKLRGNSIEPEVAIDAITVSRDGQTTQILDPRNTRLTLKPNDSLITFDLTALDFAYPQANTYSYRLTGLQPNWTLLGTAHQIIFPSLHAGHYQLEVRGANNWGIWSKQPATLNIIVLPPWWRTWWAYAIYALLILMLLASFVYSQKRKVLRERRISDELREANEIKAGFLSKLEEQVQRATRELRGTLETVNLKNVELEIAHKRASAGEQVKSQFLANMSHELRTPLTAILGYLKLLAHTRLSVEQEDYLRTVRHSSESLLAIINDTLDISRLEAGKLLIDEVDFDLLDVIESTVELLAPTAYQKQLELLRIVPPGVSLRLRGDPLRVRQVLTNLVGNAIKFTEHGSVCIRVHEVQHNEREARLAIAVSDTGSGIPQESLAKLFEAYVRNEQPAQPHVEGTGLGLAICKRLLELMGGEITVFSTPGVGSTFEFQLPFKLQKAYASPPHLTRPAKVLLLDPHPLSSQAWSASLARFGADVTVTRVPEAVGRSNADALLIALSPDELTQHQSLAGALIANSLPRLVLAPTVERHTLEQFARDFRCRALSKSAREETVFTELRSVLHALPAAEPAPGKSARVPVPQDAPLILIADDNAINRKLLATLLRQNGWRVAEAASGEEFLALAGKESWAAALLDIHMPDLSGMTTLARLREQYTGTLPPVIAVSADASPNTRTQALANGMRDYLVKPYTEEQLLAVLRKHLPKHTTKPE